MPDRAPFDVLPQEESIEFLTRRVPRVYANIANDCARLAETAQARALGEDGLARHRKVMGENHPYTLECAMNLLMDLCADGSNDEADSLPADAIRTPLAQTISMRSPPEGAYREEGVDTMEHAADRSRVLAPWRLAASAAPGQRHRHDVEQRRELEVLTLVREGNSGPVQTRWLRQAGRAEGRG